MERHRHTEASIGHRISSPVVALLFSLFRQISCFGLIVASHSAVAAPPTCPNSTTTSGLYCLTAIDQYVTPGGDPGSNFALDQTGAITYLKFNNSTGYADLWRGNGTTVPSLIYASPAVLSPSAPSITGPSFQLSVDPSGNALIAGQVATQVASDPVLDGFWLIGTSGITPVIAWDPLAGSANQLGRPNAQGLIPYLYSPNPGVTQDYLSLLQPRSPLYYNPAVLDTSIGVPFGNYLPGINNRGDAVWAYGVYYGTGVFEFDFYTGTPGSDHGSLIDFGNLNAAFGSGALIGSESAYHAGHSLINELDFAPVIYMQGGETKLALVRLDPNQPIVMVSPDTYPNTLNPIGATPPVNPPVLVHGGTIGNGNYGGMLCGNPSINNFNELVFIAGSGPTPVPGAATSCQSVLYVTDPSGSPPHMAVNQGDTFSYNNTSYSVSAIRGTSPQSINDRGQIAFIVDAVPSASPGSSPISIILRADPQPGISPASPILPPAGTTAVVKTLDIPLGPYLGGYSLTEANICTLGSNTCFVSAVGPCPVGVPAGCAVPMVWLDPALAAGYTFTVGSGSPPFIAAYIAAPLPHGQSSFTLQYAGVTTSISVGQPVDFRAVAPQGVSTFTISGINASELLDPTNPASFTAGVAFGSTASTDFSVNVASLASVPNVVGLAQADATTALTGAAFTVGSITTQTSAAVAAGSVISESPVAGTLVTPESVVSLVVSIGAPVAVPNVVGLTQTAASNAITTAGLSVGTVTQQSSTAVAAGSVISESPVAGSQVAPGSAVNLVVSTGAPTVAVPNVVGLTQTAASNAITTAALSVGTVTQQSSTTVVAGSVISENPVAGTQVAPESAVNLVVSTGTPGVAVPNVVGSNILIAAVRLLKSHFLVGTVTLVKNTTVPVGQVLTQSPAAGATAQPWSGVALSVSVRP